MQHYNIVPVAVDNIIRSTLFLKDLTLHWIRRGRGPSRSKLPIQSKWQLLCFRINTPLLEAERLLTV
jgi:hypothetical protein